MRYGLWNERAQKRAEIPWLDAVSTPKHILCNSRRVVLAWTSPIIEVRRASDNALADIGCWPNGWLDWDAIAAHCGASAGFLRRTYDQSGNGRDHLHATAGQQPQIWDGSKPSRLGASDGLGVGATFDGTNDTQSTTAAAVGTGNPALTVVVAATITGGAGFLFNIGDQTNALRQMRSTVLSSTSMAINAASSGFQAFTVDDISRPHWYQVSKAASVSTAAWTFRQDGAQLTASSSGGADNLAIVSGNVSNWGCRTTGAGALADFLQLRSSFFAVWGSVPSTEQQQLIDGMMRLLLLGHNRT